MKKVYVLYAYEQYEGRDVIGVFSTEAKAVKAGKEILRRQKLDVWHDDHVFGEDIIIKTYNLDELLLLL